MYILAYLGKLNLLELMIVMLKFTYGDCTKLNFNPSGLDLVHLKFYIFSYLLSVYINFTWISCKLKRQTGKSKDWS